MGLGTHTHTKLTHLHADLPNGPGRIVADGDELRVEVGAQDRHELSYGEAGSVAGAPPPHHHIFLGSPCFAPPLPGVALQPWHLPMQGLTCTKQALVRSPRRAKELCRTSGMVSCGEQAGMGVSTADGCEHRGESRQPPGQDGGGGGRGGPSPACTGRAASLCCCEPPAAPRGSQDPRPNHSAGPGPRS